VPVAVPIATQPEAPAEAPAAVNFRDHERDVILRTLRETEGVIGDPGGTTVFNWKE
jgi:hypothetical protein